jgi:hypothetical protein
VVSIVQPADFPDPIEPGPIAQLASKGEARIRGVNDQPVGADQVDDLADGTGLRVVWMHVEVLRHAPSLGGCHPVAHDVEAASGVDQPTEQEGLALPSPSVHHTEAQPGTGGAHESRREGWRAGFDEAWSRSPRSRSDSGISAIFASTALSSSALSARGLRRAAAFSSWARSFIAARSSSVNPSYVFSIAVVLLADFCVSFNLH